MAKDAGDDTGADADTGADTHTAAPTGIRRLIARVTRIVHWVQATTPMRAFTRFSGKRGGLLAAGMSYQALFAVLAALWLVFAVAGLWLSSNQELLKALIELINQGVPGLIGADGVISEAALSRLAGTLGWTGLIAAIGLLWTAIGWLASTREAIRTMFDVPDDTLNVILQKLRDLGLALGFGILLTLAAAVSLLSTSLLGTALNFFDVPADSFWATFAGRAVSFVIVVALNTVTLATMYRVLSRLVIPWRALLAGAAAGSVALAVLSTLSGLVLRGASNNPLAASFAAVLGLLIWFNLVCQVILIGAAWISVALERRGLPVHRPVAKRRRRKPAAAELAPETATSDAPHKL
ncbi:YihY/virulence factor BrkB family protein [Rathayibacter soli]|uniref:YihY/virulence factor BrkB family protein n=1 Tax=Rathayibacter soli TaxID=3144168 RepID=UPI0027E507B6|nr:YihY/virulence factor BrkB family protein [Glaciibacter superstes]